MTLRAPLPIERTERSATQAEGIEPGDLAPCLVQPEIWVRGHAWHPAALGAPSMRVHLGLVRDTSPVMRKSVEIPVQRGAAVPPLLHALGPLSRAWPVRMRLLGGLAASAMDQSPLELPDVFDWNYFQAAPADQRLGPLRGDEWIRLEGIHPTIHQFDTRLPSAICAIVMFGKTEPLRRGVPVRVGLDSIQIDVDQGWCALVFRGHTPLPANMALDDLQFVAGLGLPDRPLPKLEPRISSPPETFVFDEAMLEAAAKAPLPFQQPPSPPETSVFDEAMLEAAAKDPLPFQQPSSPLPPSAPQPKPPNRTPDPHGSSSDTFPLDESKLVAIANAGALPFRENSPKGPVQSTAETFVFDESLLDAAANKKALPFEEVSPARPPSDKPPPIESPSVPDPQVSKPSTPLLAATVPAAPVFEVAQTFMLPDEMSAKLAEEPATPFVGGDPLPPREEPLDALAALPFQPAAPDESTPGKLGSFFLAAMDEALRTRGQTKINRPGS